MFFSSLLASGAVPRLGRRGDVGTVRNWLNGHRLPSPPVLAVLAPVAQWDSALSF